MRPQNGDYKTARPARRVVGAVRRDDTIRRIEACASTFIMTWTSDDRQFSVFADGAELRDPPSKAYHTKIYAISGGPENPTIEDVAGYPDMPMRLSESDYASFWGGSCLAIENKVYQFLATSNRPYLLPDGTFAPDFHMDGSKLIFSNDNGRSWSNQDGSTPVVWDNWNERSRDNMMFFGEHPPGAFSFPVFLQMGKGYELNEDGYAYIYSMNGGADDSANQLVVFRVSKDRIRERNNYEFFAGFESEGGPAWSRDIGARSPMHTFPPGWVSGPMPGAIPRGWDISVVYNEGFGLYLMAAQGTGPGPNGGWFGKPSYLGFWVSHEPWGPFRQIHEETEWLPEGEKSSRAFAPQIPPKWIAADGESFWLVWSDYGTKPGSLSNDGEFNPDRSVLEALKNINDDAEFARAYKEWNARNSLHVSLNMQRVDLEFD